MRVCSLKEFLNIKPEYSSYKIKKNNCIYKWEDNEYKKIAKNHINITNIYCDEFNTNSIILTVDFTTPDEMLYDYIDIDLAYKRRRIAADWNHLYKMVEPDIVTGFHSKIENLYNKYFRYCVTRFIEENPVALSDCGWLQDDNNMIFVSINDDFPTQKKIAKDFFNGGMKAKIYQQKLSGEMCHDFFQLLFHFPSALTIFAYSIHAVLWYYLHPYEDDFWEDTGLNVDTIQFSLCIYGNNSKSLRVVANLFSNFFLIGTNRWSIIDKKYHISASSVSDEKYRQLPKYRCVPIIFSSRRDNLTKASSIIKKVQKQRNRHRLHIYPVYINRKEICVDEMINCCIDSMEGQIPLENEEWLSKIHSIFCVLIYKFIEYLTELSQNEPSIKRSQLTNILYQFLKQENLPPEWLDSYTPEVLLYSTMKAFTIFLSDNHLDEYVDMLEKSTCTALFEPGAGQESDQIAAPVQRPDTFLHNFRDFIHASLKQKSNSDWIFKGTETRGNEECYYFYPKIGYIPYRNFIKKSQYRVLSKRELGQKLRESGILKVPSSGTSNTMKRTKRGIYVYVIKRDLLEKI